MLRWQPRPSILMVAPLTSSASRRALAAKNVALQTGLRSAIMFSFLVNNYAESSLIEGTNMWRIIMILLDSRGLQSAAPSQAIEGTSTATEIRTEVLMH